jgi:NADH:ubiquinone reductase (H+-translocating)
MSTVMPVQRLVIIGGGFAGVTVAQEAERRLEPSVEIVVISRDNHLVFTPMLPEVAGRTISPFHVAVPGRSITKRTLWMEADVTAIDTRSSTVRYLTSENAGAELSYTHLVLACGSETDLDTIPGLSAHSFAIKTAVQAIVLGNEVIARFEQAALEKDEVRRRELLTIIVIGGGFSGVEIAGQLNDLMREIHPAYPQLKTIKPSVIILHGGDRVLPEFSHESLSDFTCRKLTASGVDVRLNTRVAEVTQRGVVLTSATLVPGRLVVCAVGTTPSRLISSLGVQLEKGRLKTDPDLRVPGESNVWALGDCAVTINAFDGKPTPATAQFAMREGAHLAKNLHRLQRGLQPKPFYFRPQGLLASIGRKTGVAEIYGFRFSGRIAWFLWRGVYLFKMPGLGTKIGVALDWLVGAFFSPPIVRLLVPGIDKSRRIHYAAADPVSDGDRPSKEVIFIQEGKVGLYLDGATTPLVELEKGDYFGSAVFRDEVRGAPARVTIRAETSVDVLAVSASAFSEVTRLVEPLQANLQRSLQARAMVGHLLQRQINDVTLSKLCVRDVVGQADALLAGQSSLADVLNRFGSNVGGYWVVDDGKKLLGYLGRLEVSNAISKGSGAVPIMEIVRNAAAPLHPDQGIFPATLALLRSEFDTLPVVDETGRVTGLYDPLVLLRIVFGQTEFKGH